MVEAKSGRIAVYGLAELKKALEGLPAKIEGNVMRGALRAGAAVFRDAAKRGAPEDSGALRKSIRIVSRRQKRGTGWINIDIKAGDNRGVWYAHLIEFGTASFYTGTGQSIRKPYIIRGTLGEGQAGYGNKKRGRGRFSEVGDEATATQKRNALRFGDTFVGQVTHPGIKPTPFMRQTFDSSANQMAAIEATAAYIRRRLPKEITKAGL